MSQTHIIAGSGICGLISALLVISHRPGERVVLVEREPEIGGLLRSFDYGDAGRFDYGMHNMAETGIEELDELLTGLLPRAEWQLLEGTKRDIAGLYFNGRLQRNTLYPDLRDSPQDFLRNCIGDFFANLSVKTTEFPSALHYMRSRFGHTIANNVAGPVLTKLFRQPPEKLDVMAPLLTSFTRVALFDEEPFRDLMLSQLLRDRVAYPEQRNLPSQYASGRRGFYPVKYGSYRIVDAIRARLEDLGAEIHVSAEITSVAQDDQGATAAQLKVNGRKEDIRGPLTLYWTAGVPALARLLGLPSAKPPPDRPLRTVVINLLINQPLDVGDLYYFYCYDEGFNTFRVTNYSGYCEGAARKSGIPICVEFLLDSDTMPPSEALPAMAWKELERFGVLAPGTKMLFGRAAPLATGFPMPTLANMRALDKMRIELSELRLKNVLSLGILAEPKLFFQRDVLVHTYNKVTERWL